MTIYTFDGDAMLMYGWVADAGFMLQHVNPRLRSWLKKSGNASLLRKIDRRRADLTELFDSLLGEEDSGVGERVKDLLDTLRTDIESPNRRKHQYPKTAYYDTWRAFIDYIEDQRLAGVRAVKDEGFQLVSRNPEGDGTVDPKERVDLISVCLFDKNNWKILAYQGQLQEAWLRVVPALRRGTQAGTLSLICRNLSHNIGSHALFHLESNIPYLLGASGGGHTESNKSKAATALRRFLTYIRERTEYLAGFATDMPLSPASRRIDLALKEFHDNKLLTDYLCRSEGVHRVNIKYYESGRHRDLREVENLEEQEGTLIEPLWALFPTGNLGTHAIFILLENILRDSAKYGEPTEEMNLEVRVDDYDDEYLLVRVTVPQTTKPEHLQDYLNLGRNLDRIEIASPSGTIYPNAWGLKERFIAAAHLRGLRPSEILPYMGRNQFLEHLPRGSSGLAIRPDCYDGPQLLTLNLDDEQQEPVWSFYLLKPKNILLISDVADTGQEWNADPLYNDLVDKLWLEDHLHDASAIRHHFVVLRPATLEQAERWKNDEVSTRLPCRTFMIDPPQPHEHATFNPAPFIHLPQRDLQDLRGDVLHATHLEHLLSVKGLQTSPSIVLVGQFPRSEVLLQEPRVTVVPSHAVHNAENLEAVLAKESSSVALFIRHYHSWFNQIDHSEGQCSISFGGRAGELAHFEPHEFKDPIRRRVAGEVIERVLAGEPDERNLFFLRLITAALSRVLIVDERLSATTKKQEIHAGFNAEQVFGWKGIHFLEIRPTTGQQNGPTWLSVFESLIEKIRRLQYDYLLLHHGIVDKIRHELHIPAGAESTEILEPIRLAAQNTSPEGQPRPLLQIIVHTARMRSDLQTRHLPYSNIAKWVNDNFSKVRIIEDLARLRRTS